MHAHHYVKQFGPLEVFQVTEEQRWAGSVSWEMGSTMGSDLVVTNHMGDSDINDDKDRGPL